jgi:hypothetical protein
MHKSATKCNETLGKWCKNKHGASKIMDTLETYQQGWGVVFVWVRQCRDGQTGLTNSQILAEMGYSELGQSTKHALSVKIEFFCEGSTKNTLKNYATLIFNNSRTHFTYISPFFVCMKLCINLAQKRQTLADSAGSEVNLNYNCIIVFPWFFQKIIFMLTSRCLS